MTDKKRDTPQPSRSGTGRPPKDNEVSLIDLNDQHIEANKQDKRK